jgi:hypothetical protein
MFDSIVQGIENAWNGGSEASSASSNAVASGAAAGATAGQATPGAQGAGPYDGMYSETPHHRATPAEAAKHGAVAGMDAGAAAAPSEAADVGARVGSAPNGGVVRVGDDSAIIPAGTPATARGAEAGMFAGSVTAPATAPAGGDSQPQSPTTHTAAPESGQHIVPSQAKIVLLS